MKIRMSTNDFLVLRDGHPFGDSGIVEGYSEKWPLPQTIVGMLRTKIGMTKDVNYFQNEQNRKDIFKFGIKQQIPFYDDDKFFAPLPADVIFTQQIRDEKISVNIPQLSEKTEKCGTDIKNGDWIIPSLDIKDKPVKQVPLFLYWDVFEKYLNDELRGDVRKLYQFGCSKPITDDRLHNALDSETLTTEKGRLFSNKGVYMKVVVSDKKKHDINLLLELEGDFTGLNISGDAYLGGERKTVNLQPSKVNFPDCPDIFQNRRYLKLILSTHGDFGSWCPGWLRPDLEQDEIDWVTIPGSEYLIRLRTAYINGHNIVSGWDYVTRKPKASKKLVIPGAVYVVELKNPKHSQAIAELFWGNSLDLANKETALNGYGQLFVGNTIIEHVENNKNGKV